MARTSTSNNTIEVSNLIESEERRNNVFEIAFWILSVLLVLITITLRLFSFSEVSGDSMLNTIRDQDIAVCAPTWKIERGDIVTAQADEDKVIIKRVVAVPGDKIVFRIVDGAEGEEEKVVELYIDTGDGFEKIAEEYIYGGVMNVSGFSSQTMFRQYQYRLFSGQMQNLSDKYVITMGEDEYFLLGDNRDNSKDSRSYGAFDKDQLVGKVVKIATKGSALYWLIDGMLFN